MADQPNGKDLAWPLFDAIVHRASSRDANPWTNHGSTFEPDYETLCRLLAVPLSLGAGVRSGVPALALDVWVAYELRRAGLEEDRVWPRAEPPRVVSRDLLNFVASVPQRSRRELLTRLSSGKSNGGTTGASANLLGKNYTKQVDVVMSSWETGPEVLISTKRMESSFGNNAANRIEESYGDAKNLRLRYPQAACGFVFGLRSTAWDKIPKPGEAGIAERLVDLLAKMGREPDAYHATALVVPEYEGSGPADDGDEPDEDDAVAVEAGPVEEESTEDEQKVNVDAELARLPGLRLRRDLVPDDVDPGRFFTMMLDTVLTNTPVSYHRTARELRAKSR